MRILNKLRDIAQGRWWMAALLGGWMTLAGCEYEHHHDRDDYYGRPAGYRVDHDRYDRDHYDRDRDWDHRDHDSREHDWDRR